MSKITRKTSLLFAVSGAGTDVEQFASFEVNGSPNYTTSPTTIQALPAWKLGWSASQFQGVFAPYFQDRNGVDLVAIYQLSYLLQEGIAEWDSGTTYYLGSLVNSGHAVFISAQDNNLGNAPPASGSNAFWTRTAFPSVLPAISSTRTVLLSGSGTYTPPPLCARIFARLVGAGGGGCGNGGDNGQVGGTGGSTTLGSLTAGGGAGGQSSNPAQLGGPGGVATGGDVNVSGQAGFEGITLTGAPSNSSNYGAGGNSKLGGGAPVSRVSGNAAAGGFNAAANTGSGGGGGVAQSIGFSSFGSGGGAGAYLEKTILSPSAMAYNVGAGGAGAGSSTGTGGNGGSGIIVVDEFYY